jgi:hypothetical protein
MIPGKCCIVAATVTGLAWPPVVEAADSLFYAKVVLPVYNDKPAAEGELSWCDVVDAAKNDGHTQLCTNRVVREVEHGLYAYETGKVPDCIKGSNSISWASLAADVAAPPEPTSLSDDIIRAMGEQASKFGVVRGSVGRWLHPYGNSAARCVVIETTLPAKATTKEVDSRVFDPDQPTLGWASCIQPECRPPGFCGWDKSVERRGDVTAGVFKNWLHNGRRFVLMDVRYYP